MPRASVMVVEDDRTLEASMPGLEALAKKYGLK